LLPGIKVLRNPVSNRRLLMSTQGYQEHSMRVLACATAGAFFLLAASALPVGPAQAMPFDATAGTAVDDLTQQTQMRKTKKPRRVGVAGSIRRDLGGRGPGGGLPLGRGTSTSPGGIPSPGGGGMGR
jgi:hypothetical protein